MFEADRLLNHSTLDMRVIKKKKKKKKKQSPRMRGWRFRAAAATPAWHIQRTWGVPTNQFVSHLVRHSGFRASCGLSA